MSYTQKQEKLREIMYRFCPEIGKEEDYFPHRIGSHSDDYGGDSDLPCYCNKPKPPTLEHLLRAINKPVKMLTKIPTVPIDVAKILAIYDLTKSPLNQEEKTLDSLLEILS